MFWQELRIFGRVDGLGCDVSFSKSPSAISSSEAPEDELIVRCGDLSYASRDIAVVAAGTANILGFVGLLYSAAAHQIHAINRRNRYCLGGVGQWPLADQDFELAASYGRRAG